MGQRSVSSAVWMAVGGQPVSGALDQMQYEGWNLVRSIAGELGVVMLERENISATLYVRNETVGMVMVQ